MGIISENLVTNAIFRPGDKVSLHDKEIEVLSKAYILSALTQSASQYLKEQWWLYQRDGGESFDHFLPLLFKEYLSSVHFLQPFLKEDTSFKELSKRSRDLEGLILEEVLLRTQGEQKKFLSFSLLSMKELFLSEEGDQVGSCQSEGHKGLELYRTFDGLDVIFDLNYQLDRDMVITQQKERLYEKAGVGVQSGYSTILLALAYLEENYGLEGKTIVDLGSGYGRVGLVSALYCEEMDFIGYEYVGHRVDVSNRAVRNLKLQESLNFITQDLSLTDFKIPKADVFYLYDPFTEETYQSVLKQIVEMSYNQRVIVVTKGNAREWLVRVSQEQNWSSPVLIDEGNLCIFDSKLSKINSSLSS